jgi:CubicO group peptidase (beta-lactamase class C family)
MKMRIVFIKILLLILVGVSSYAQINPNVNTGFDNKVQCWLTQNNVPAVGVGIIENGKIKYVKVFGELKKSEPAPDNSIFNIASMTKPVVAMLTLKLTESGQWDIDEPLFHYWIDPDVANDPFNEKLTTRHVLSHQTGFPNWRWTSASKKLSFEFEPGTKFQYSGEGFEYLRKALENKFHKPLEKMLDSIIFQPLGMHNTTYWNKNIDMHRYARWHDAQGNEYKTLYQTGVSAADFLLTTAEDYCKYMIDVINGAGLSTDLYNEMIKPQVYLKEHYAKGLGWEVINGLPNNEYSLEHGGSDPGVKTMAIALPLSKRGIVILTNGDNGMFVIDSIVKESIDIGEQILLKMNSNNHSVIVKISDEILVKYSGTYKDTYGRTLTITKEDNTLKFSGEWLPTVIFFPEAENKFFLKGQDVQIEFTDDDTFVGIANGKIDWTAKKIK